MDDNMILDLYFGRRESALDETKTKYGRRLHRTAMNILHSNEDAEECVNDTLFKAWESIPPARPGNLGAYLAKITRNIAINRWEAKSAKKRGGGDMTILLSELEDCLPASDSPEDSFEAKVVTEAINVFLDTLEKSTRAVFVLRYFHGDSIRDISKRYRVSESNIKSVLFRLRKKLRVFLEKEGIAI